VRTEGRNAAGNFGIDFERFFDERLQEKEEGRQETRKRQRTAFSVENSAGFGVYRPYICSKQVSAKCMALSTILPID